jgi:hypothetical protein
LITAGNIKTVPGFSGLKDRQEIPQFYAELVVVRSPYLDCSGIKNYVKLLKKNIFLNQKCDLWEMKGGSE